MTEVTIPHNYTPKPYQLEYLKAKQRFKICVWHRRAGKSKTALNEQIRKTQLRKGIYYVFAPTYKQAKQIYFDSLVREHVPRELVEKINESELAIYYKNGSIQRFAGCEDIDKHRGINPIDVVFDEFSEEPEHIWTAIIQPVLRENKGTATFIFTPKGKNHSWKLLQLAKDNPKEWFWSVQSVKDTNTFTEDELTEIRRNTPEALYNQEYLCEFMENAGAFFRRIRQNTYKADTFLPEQGDFQIGADLAQYQDWTVLTPFNTNFFIAYAQERFNQVDWNLQKARIEAMARRHTNELGQTALIWPDSTGVGSPVVQDLVARGLRIGGDDERGFVFTETSRKNLLDNLAILLEQDKIKIPDDEGLLTELEAFQYSLSERGKVKVTVPDGMTDDRVMSLALSVWGVREPVRPNPDSLMRVQRNREKNRSFA